MNPSDECREALLPCPFCGANVYVQGDLNLEHINCPTIGCAAEVILLPAHRPERKRESIQKWNRRAPVAQAVTLTDDQIADIAYRAGWDIRYEDIDGDETDEPHLWSDEGDDSFDALRRFAHRIAPLLVEPAQEEDEVVAWQLIRDGRRETFTSRESAKNYLRMTPGDGEIIPLYTHPQGNGEQGEASDSLSDHGYFVSGPSGSAIVYDQEHVESVIAAIAKAEGDDTNEYTCTDLSKPRQSAAPSAPSDLHWRQAVQDWVDFTTFDDRHSIAEWIERRAKELADREG